MVIKMGFVIGWTGEKSPFFTAHIQPFSNWNSKCYSAAIKNELTQHDFGAGGSDTIKGMGENHMA